MAIVDPEAFSQVLGAVDLRVGVSRRTQLPAGELLPLSTSTATLLYIAEGRVHGIPPLDSGCRLEADRDELRLAADPGRSTLRAGDAFLTLGRAPLALEADADTVAVLVDLEFADSTSLFPAVLPDRIIVTGFDAVEPAAAALARHMGAGVTPAGSARRGDPLICLMMAKTILLSLIRAWAENGCAPEGWPSVSKDPFLDRVVEAIHDEPGRDWTVERLASVGAMSRSAFAERFRAAIGRSPADYVTEVRVETAKRMLAAGRSVSETSRELGYASDEGFSRAFRRRTGMTPSAWRARTPVPA